MTPIGRNIAAALRWAHEAPRRSTRGSRAVAWDIAVFGIQVIDGAANIPDAAKARGIPAPTLYADLNWLRIHYGLTFSAQEIVTAPGRDIDDFPLSEADEI